MIKKSEIYKEIKSEIDRLRRSERFYNRFNAPTLARGIAMIESRIRSENIDIDEKIELIVKLFDSEEHFVSNCDDSDGDLGDVYCEICSTFCLIVKNHKDRKKILLLIKKLIEKNNYGLHDELLNRLAEFMTKEEMKELYEYFMNLAISSTGDDSKNGCEKYIPISIAESLQDAELYEKSVRILNNGELNNCYFLNIGQIHFRNNSYDKAKEWLLTLLDKGYNQKNDIYEILLDIALAENDKELAIVYAREILFDEMSKQNYDCLVKLIGKEREDELRRDLISVIEREIPIKATKLEFLTDIDALSEVNRIIITKNNNLKGYNYQPLINCAIELENKEYFLSTSLIYRALIDELLGRAIARYYIYAIRYMKKLDVLSDKVNDWMNKPNHDDYTNELRTKHGRKTAFWKKYEDKLH
ncbi:MAG: DUF6880 family protein [bacterium]